MTLALLGIFAGFVLLVWCADRFIEGAAATARHADMPSLLIGMVIVVSARRRRRWWPQPWRRWITIPISRSAMPWVRTS